MCFQPFITICVHRQDTGLQSTHLLCNRLPQHVVTIGQSASLPRIPQTVIENPKTHQRSTRNSSTVINVSGPQFRRYKAACLCLLCEAGEPDEGPLDWPLRPLDNWTRDLFSRSIRNSSRETCRHLTYVSRH